MVGADRAGLGASVSSSGLRWDVQVQAGMQGAKAVRACAHSWRCPDLEQSTDADACGLIPRGDMFSVFFLVRVDSSKMRAI